MRTAQIIDSLTWGGAEKLQVTFAEVVRRRGIDLTVISLRQKYQSGNPEQQLKALGVPIVTFPARRLVDPARLWRLARFLRRQRFDVAQTHLTHANIIGGLACRMAGVPVVATLHNVQAEQRRFQGLRQRLEMLVLRHAAGRIVAVGHQVAHVHRGLLAGRTIDVIPNAVPTLPALTAAERMALREELVGDPSRPLLISVGRLLPQKGYPDLIAAFAELHRTHPAAALIIAGDGELRAELSAQVASSKLDGHAWLLGWRGDIPRLLAASDLFVSSSHWEGLPVAVLEAMSAGLPIVATAVGDAPHVVVEGTGVVVPPHEPACLASALRSMLDNPALMRQCGAAAQAHATLHHGPNAWVDRLLAVYAEARARPARSIQQDAA